MFRQSPRYGAFDLRSLALVLGATSALASCDAKDDPNPSEPGEAQTTETTSPTGGTSSMPTTTTPAAVQPPVSPSNTTGPGNGNPAPSTGPVQTTPTTTATTVTNEPTTTPAGTTSEPEVTSEPPVLPGDCETPSSRVSFLMTTSIADMGVPFDADQEDTIGPADWNSNYGKTPELMVHSEGDTFDVLWRDTAAENQAFVVHVTGGGNGDYLVSQAYKVETLGQLMGFTRDDEGNYYFATGVDEDEEITVEYPAEGEFRPDIVRLVKFSPGGCVLWETDVDTARGEVDGEAEPIVNPMVAGTSRLVWGGGQLALVHSINTAPDDSGVRHQKALTTHFDASDGAVARTAGLWVSHSFDQRLLWNGEGFIDVHLGDAYPRSIVMSLSDIEDESEGYELYFPKGEEGDNATYTQLGAIVPVAAGDYGYWVFFATDRSPDLATEQWQSLVGTRDVALTRVTRDFATSRPRDGGFLEQADAVHEVVWKGETVANPLRWVTDLGAGGAEVHAGRVRAAATADEHVVVMWEQWDPGERRETFVGTFAIELDADAQVVAPAKLVSERHIPRGDDAFTLASQAALLLGNQDGSLTLQLLETGLETRAVVLP